MAADTDGKIFLGGAETTIAELAGLDMSSVREVRTSRLPPGIFAFQVTECEFKTVEIAVGDDKVPTAVISMVCEVQEPLVAMKWPEGTDYGDMSDLVGKKHTESFFLKDADGLGRFKALLVDIGFTTSGKAISLQELMAAIVGFTFKSAVKYSKNKNDPDEPYTNLKALKKAA